jgi:hypothetical protein
VVCAKPKPQSQPEEARASSHVWVSGFEPPLGFETMTESTFFDDALTASVEIDTRWPMTVLLTDDDDPQRFIVPKEIVVVPYMGQLALEEITTVRGSASCTRPANELTTPQYVGPEILFQRGNPGGG